MTTRDKISREAWALRSKVKLAAELSPLDSETNHLWGLVGELERLSNDTCDVSNHSVAGLRKRLATALKLAIQFTGKAL